MGPSHTERHQVLTFLAHMLPVLGIFGDADIAFWGNRLQGLRQKTHRKRLNLAVSTLQ